MLEMLNTKQSSRNFVLLKFKYKVCWCLFGFAGCSRSGSVVLVSGAGCDNVTTVLLGAQIKMSNGFPQPRLSFYTLHAPAHATIYNVSFISLLIQKT